jgi:anti-sigma factor RsiW
MDCQFTEEVSLLVDGELAPHEAARLCAHIEGCAACRHAREAFLLLRKELRSYEWAADPYTQSSALASILGAHTSESKTAAPSAGAWATNRPSTPRTLFGRLSERLNEAFSVRRLRPAHVATLALLLIACVLSVRWLTSSNYASRTPQSGASAVANVNSPPVQARESVKSSENRNAIDSPTVHSDKTPKPPRPVVTASSRRVKREEARGRREGFRAGRRGLEGLRRDQPQELTRDFAPALPPSSASVVALYTASSVRVADDPALRVGRHAERVERLFRSFRNARLTESDTTLDVADARRLSKRLLYSNIALRREAERAGDLPVEGLLDSVEPILVDISNLPNSPSPDAVGSIKERIRRRQLVGALQAQGMLASR